MKKRILSTALAALMLIGCVGVTASADDSLVEAGSSSFHFTVSNVASQETLPATDAISLYSNSNLKDAISALDSYREKYEKDIGVYGFIPYESLKFEIFHCSTPATISLVGDSENGNTLIQWFAAISLETTTGGGLAANMTESKSGNRYDKKLDTFVDKSNNLEGDTYFKGGSFITALLPGLYYFQVQSLGQPPYNYILDVAGDSSTATTDVVITGEQQYDYSKQFRYEIRNASNSIDKHRYAIVFTHFLNSSLYPDLKQSTEIHFLSDSDILAGAALSGHFYSQIFSYNDHAKTVTSTHIIAFDNASEMNTVVAGAPLLDMSDSLGPEGRFFNAYYDPNGLCFEVDDSTTGEKWLKDTFGITR